MRSSRARLAITLVAVAGCSFDRSGSGGDGDGGADPSDGGPAVDGGSSDADPGDACNDWDPAAPFDPCSIAEEDRDVFLSLELEGEYGYDTDTGVMTDPGGQPLDLQPFSELINGQDVRLMSVAGLDIGADAILVVRGSVPLLVASWGPIEVDGQLDLSSGRGLGTGAGGATDPCDLSQNGPSALGAGGGGGGGSFGGEGGTGGSGDAPPSLVVDGAPGLRGGCGGGDGGVGGVGSASGGAGGGAVALSSRFGITVDGTIHAGGGGGEGGPDGGGGGGGGSGGLIWLDAVGEILVTSVGVVTANGGGGGEGSLVDPGEPGDPAPITGARASAGKGGGAGDGGDGGDGSGDDEVDGEPGSDGNTSGGGGGGGGAGIIRVDGSLETPGDALLSPPPSVFTD